MNEEREGTVGSLHLISLIVIYCDSPFPLPLELKFQQTRKMKSKNKKTDQGRRQEDHQYRDKCLRASPGTRPETALGLHPRTACSSTWLWGRGVSNMGHKLKTTKGTSSALNITHNETQASGQYISTWLWDHLHLSWIVIQLHQQDFTDFTILDPAKGKFHCVANA